jgi:arsenate reductase
MAEKNLDLRSHFPKSIRHLSRARFDLVINMSGFTIPDRLDAPVRDWDVDDPVSMPYDDHCAIRDQIESLVVQLVLELRREQTPPLR